LEKNGKGGKFLHKFKKDVTMKTGGGVGNVYERRIGKG
jgi:hypothetical protein